MLPDQGLTIDLAQSTRFIWLPKAALLLGFALIAFAGSWAFARRGVLGRASMIVSLFLIAFIADRNMGRLGREFMPPLNEGSILDMPVTIPRASITQVTDDLKARDAILRQMPEVELIVGKAGRAETPTDPAPPDMVETVINLRPEEFWPKRELRYEDALKQTARVVDAARERRWLSQLDTERQEGLVNDVTMHAVGHFDHAMRAQSKAALAAFQEELGQQLIGVAVMSIVEDLAAEGHLARQPTEAEITEVSQSLNSRYAKRLSTELDLITSTQLARAIIDSFAEKRVLHADADVFQLNRNALGEFLANGQELLGIDRATYFTRLHQQLEQAYHDAWVTRIQKLNWELADAAGPLYTWQAIAELKKLAESQGIWATGDLTPDSVQAIRSEVEPGFTKSVFLWRKTRGDLVKEMDTLVQMPGWGNIWTQPIINRVDMLATGVRTMIGVKVYGDDLNAIQKVSERVAQVLKKIRGAADVFPDQIVGEGYLEIDIDREKAARYGVSVGDIQDVVETALGGQVVTTTVEGRERFPVRIRYARDFRLDEESIKQLLVSGGSNPQMADSGQMGPSNAPASASTAQQVPLSQVAEVRIVEGPSMIKSENGLLRAYVQLNVRDRDIVGFVEEAQRAVAAQVSLPPGMYLEWSGQFEHQVRARRTLSIIFPVVILVIFLILYLTYHDFLDSVLVLGLAVPGAIAGGILFQYLFGFNFSVAVWVGYIACFGLATENGLVMLVYLREAIDERGGLENLTLPQLRDAVMQGAVHRTRPKLLTEVTAMVGLAPMLWATGTGAEIMQPMAAPVLGGILVSDEVVDLLLPVLFYQVRKWRWHRLKKQAAPAATVDRPETFTPAMAGTTAGI
jgi:Cu(I)/Ag(I) efflux system membrane protein CusA/SilA